MRGGGGGGGRKCVQSSPAFRTAATAAPLSFSHSPIPPPLAALLLLGDVDGKGCSSREGVGSVGREGRDEGEEEEEMSSLQVDGATMEVGF